MMNPNASSLRFTQRISSKLIGAVILTLIVVLGASMSAVSWIVWTDFYKNAEAASLASVDRARDVASAYADAAQTSANRDFVLFKSRYEGGEFDLASGRLRWKGQELDGDTAGVDAFKRETGGSVATLFVRDGEDFRRITTSVLRQDGQRAVGTLLDRNHPAYALMAKGERYAGPANLFGRPYMTVYEPIRSANQTIGILFTGTDITEDLRRVLSGLGEIQVGETGRVYAVDLRAGAQQGALLGLDDPAARIDLNAANGKAWFDAIAAVRQQAELHLAWSPLAPSQASLERFVGVARFDVLGWALVSEAPKREMMQSARHALTFLWLGVLSAMVLLSLVLARAVTVVVVRPIAGLTGALGYLSQGDLTHHIASRTQDEVGRLSNDMEQFRLSLRDSLTQVSHSAGVVSLSSREIADGNNDLSQRTERQASALEQTAASMEEMGATVQQNAENAGAAHRLASQASEVAQQGGQKVSDLVASMKAINHSSQKIADIIAVIDGIAFQTNILALNAAVEAARAGEQGRGFAVVAGEVRTLAQRSAAAAKEIKTLITQSVEDVRLGSSQVDQARATMDNVVVSIGRVAQTIAEISAASREQSDGVTQVGEAIVQLDQTTQQNAALVEEMAAAAASLSTQSQQLVEVVARFQLGGGSAGAGRRQMNEPKASAPKIGMQPMPAAKRLTR